VQQKTSFENNVVNTEEYKNSVLLQWHLHSQTHKLLNDLIEANDGSPSVWDVSGEGNSLKE
jgi:hypothetical protein